MLDLLLVSLLDQIVLVSGPRNTGCHLTAGSQDHTSGFLMSGLYTGSTPASGSGISLEVFLLVLLCQ